MEQLGFPKIIKLGEYEFKFLTELEVERDNNGNIINQTMEDIFNKEKNNNDKLEDFENGNYCIIKTNKYNINDAHCIYFLITEDNNILNNIHSNTNFGISLFNKVNLSNLVLRKTKTRNYGTPSFRRLNRLVCYMKKHNKRVAVYYMNQLNGDTKQLKNVIDYVKNSNTYSFFTIKDIDKELIIYKKINKNIGEEMNNIIEKIVELLKFKKQIILQGAPGTGKTYTAKKVAEKMINEMNINDEKIKEHYDIVQFHPSYTYEDFVRGISAKSENGNITYEIEDKILMNAVNKANEAKDKPYILIIDEINRANLPSVLGELLYALEYRGEEVKCPYGESITIPENLYIIGTMNTADRSIGSIDYAIRRRFAFYTVSSNSNIIEDKEAKSLYKQVYELIDKHISEEYNIDDIMVGHSYFLPEEDDCPENYLELSLEYNIIPLLMEYYKDGILIDKDNIDKNDNNSVLNKIKNLKNYFNSEK